MKFEQSNKFSPPSSAEDDDDKSNQSESELHEELDSSMNGSSRGFSGTEDKSESSRENFVREESKRVRYSKALVYFILFVCATASATATWFFVRGEEKNELEDEVSYTSWFCFVSWSVVLSA